MLLAFLVVCATAAAVAAALAGLFVSPTRKSTGTLPGSERKRGADPIELRLFFESPNFG